MYKHMADSIKETAQKRFISQEDKDKYDGYDNRFREKTDTYSKEELQDFVEEFNTKYESVEGCFISVNGTREGFVNNIEILGNTIQDINNPEDIRSVGDGDNGRYEVKILTRGVNLFNKNSEEIVKGYKLYRDDGTIIADPNYSISHYIPVYGGHITLNYRGATRVEFYDKDKKIIFVMDIETNNSVNIINISGCRYVRFNYDTSLEDNIQVVCGETMPDYKEYEESICTILLPCQLEKVGELSDRIIKKGNKWFIEKNIITDILDGSLPMYQLRTGNDISHIYQTYPIFGTGRKDNAIEVISSSFKGATSHIVFDKKSLDNIIGINKTGNIQIRINKDELNDLTIENYLAIHKPKILYTATEPEYIELPEDQQVIINTFAKSTNMVFLNEITGTIKGDIPKNTSATVDSQIDSLNSILDELENLEKLEDNTNTTVESSTGVLRVDGTNNGYLSDIVLEGNTLVNLSDTYDKITSISETPNEDGYSKKDGFFKIDFDIECLHSRYITDENINIKAGKRYTCVSEIKNNKIIDGSRAEVYPYMWRHAINKSSNSGDLEYIDSNFNGLYVFSFECISDTEFRFMYRHNNQTGRGSYEMGNIMVLEGDYSDKPISFFNSLYFKGLKSVGDPKYHIINTGIGTSGESFDFSYNDIQQDVEIYNKSNKTIIYVVHNPQTRVWIRSVEIESQTKEYVKLNAKEAIYAISLPSNKGWDINAQYSSEDIYEIDFLNHITIQSANNGNLITVDTKFTDGLYCRWEDGLITNDEQYTLSDFIKLNGEKRLRFNNCNRNVTFYREDKTFIPNYLPNRSDLDFELIVPPNAKYMRVSMLKTTKNNAHISVACDGKIDKNKQLMIDSKKLLYRDSEGNYKTPILRSVPDGTRDTIERHSDGKYYYHKRCDEMVITGNEDWKEYTYGLNNTCYMVSLLCENRFKSYTSAYCNKLKNSLDVGDINVNDEGICFNMSKAYGNVNRDVILIKVKRNRLISQDVSGMKQWLRDNMLHVVFRLKKEEVYECNQIDVRSIDGTTNLIVHSDTVPPTTKVTVRNDLNSVLSLINDKLDILENNMVYDSVYENRILLFSTYSTDHIALKSEISMGYYNSIYTEPDYDLYTLIVKIINTGEENYDLTQMEEIIDFYTMTGKLSYDMAENLFNLLSYVEIM